MMEMEWMKKLEMGRLRRCYGGSVRFKLGKSGDLGGS